MTTEEIKTPEVNEVSTEQQPTEQQTQTEKPTRPPKVVFSEEQQAKVNELIREAMGRAGREVRTERDQLKAEIEALRAERDKAQAEAQITTEQARAIAKTGMIESLASKAGFIKPTQAVALIGNRVRFDDSAKRYVVTNDDGSIATGPDGQPVPVEAYISAFAAENPHLVRSGVAPGTGSTESRQWSGETSTADTVKKLFGRGSDSRAANALAMRNPQAYKALKREAQRLGVIR